MFIIVLLVLWLALRAERSIKKEARDTLKRNAEKAAQIAHTKRAARLRMAERVVRAHKSNNTVAGNIWLNSELSIYKTTLDAFKNVH